MTSKKGFYLYTLDHYCSNKCCSCDSSLEICRTLGNISIAFRISWTLVHAGYMLQWDSFVRHKWLFFYNFIKYSLQYVEQNWKHALTSFNKCIYQMFIWYNFVLFSMYALNDMWRFWYHNFCFIRMKLYEQYDKRGERNNKSFVHDNKPYKRYKM